MPNKIVEGLKQAVNHAKAQRLRSLAVQIERYGTSNMDIALTELGESEIVAALRFYADALSR